MSKSELAVACEELNITISSYHEGIDWSEDKYPKDIWVSTLCFEGRKASFDFRTGMGSRKPDMGWKPDGPEKWHNRYSGDTVRGYADALSKRVLKTQSPEVADVLRRVIDDASACETIFDDWCSELGYNNDSLSALNVYLTCQRNGKKLYMMLGPSLVQKLRDKEH